jgi:hypothetical protein
VRIKDLDKLYLSMIIWFYAQANFRHCPSKLKKRFTSKVVRNYFCTLEEVVKHQGSISPTCLRTAFMLVKSTPGCKFFSASFNFNDGWDFQWQVKANFVSLVDDPMVYEVNLA